ncbi:MAG: gliding motility-associated C-terminal domain-containing protein [Bacteroidetes bacterium]|nr:gliding motility-associated C-terminal domain-containing protein [Bacteroidota bacterium]
MLKRVLSGLIAVFFIVLGLPLNATHIIGGELYYDCLGGNNYLITLKVYRDCLNGQAPFDNPASISVWDAGGNLLQTINLPFPGANNVPFTPNSPCFQAPPNVCVEEAIYTFQTTLPVQTSGITLAYQRCCRNNSIVNLVNPGSTGSTYQTTIPGTNLVTCNSSPRFNNFPPIAVCLGDSLKFDHSATDPDGDSLVYELCSTYHGGSVATPMPIPTSPPPFTPITFSPPFSALYPLASNPPIAIHPSTGFMTAVPNQLGQYVVGMCVREYRNGVLIGVHQRDFQFNVTACLTNTQAGFTFNTNLQVEPDGSYFICGDLLVNFTNNSVNATTFAWDFGVLGTNTDVSSAYQPQFTFPAPGVYQIQLISNPGFFCADTTYQTLTVKAAVLLNSLSLPNQCIGSQNINLTATGTLPSGTQFNWNFGPNANPSTSNQNPTGPINYNQPGQYQIRLLAERMGCKDSLVLPVKISGYAYGIPDGPYAGCEPASFTFNPQIFPENNSLLFSWNLGNGQSSTQPNPTVVYGAGTFQPVLTVISTGACVDTFNLPVVGGVQVYPIPTAVLTANPNEQSIFNPYFIFTNSSTNYSNCMFNAGDGSPWQSCQNNYAYTYDTAGYFDATLVAINQFQCSDTARYRIYVRPEFTYYVPNAFTLNADGMNEGFRGYGIGIAQYDFRIFNRWGQELFSSNDLTESWDGFYESKICPQGVYVYSADIVDALGISHRFRGKVMLIRGSALLSRPSAE